MSETQASARHVNELVRRAQDDKAFVALLTVSLQHAKDSGQAQLAPDLFAALPWPVEFSAYVEYLLEFARWIPRQSSDPAWTQPGTDEQQEVYDRLCHFYWLIDQKVGPGRSTVVENIPWFSEWLIGYANLWGSFLDTTESFDEAALRSFIDDSPEYAVGDSMIDGHPNAPSGWLTFNQFFARELNPGLRPIAGSGDNRVAVSPADCTYKAHYPIGADSEIPEIVVKKTHRFASVEELLEGSAYKRDFAGGTFVHYFLGPYSYHRFHAPVDGVVRECYPVQGRVYLDVNLSGNQFDAPDSSQGGYEFSQARGIVILDTKDSPAGDIGLVAAIPVGMAQVSSVNMTATVDRTLRKGDEFGYFLFGGSDIIVLFQAGAEAKIDTGTDYRHYGTPIATCKAR